MSGPEVDVVILTWNDGPLLDAAVDSALVSQGVDVRVFVVDNGSDPPATVVASDEHTVAFLDLQGGDRLAPYEEEVEASIAFARREHDFFLEAKARVLLELGQVRQEEIAHADRTRALL